MSVTDISLAELKKLCPTDNCEEKYYKDFHYVDVYEDPNNIKKKSVSFDKLDKDSGYSTGYFHEGQLIKLVYTGKRRIEETYILRENGLVNSAYTFVTIPQKFPIALFNKSELSSSYLYYYDAQGRMERSIWEDVSEYDKSKFIVDLDYDYDESGLRFIYKTISSPRMKTSEKIVLYDREKELFMKQFTITKNTLIEHKARQNDGLVEFDNGEEIRTKQCPHCSGRLSHVLTVDLDSRKQINKTTAKTKFPVLFCFDCLSDQNYTEKELDLSLHCTPFLKKAGFKFSGTEDADKRNEAFIAVGGHPEWIQDAEHPNCPSCNKPMVYIMTIRSREEYENGKDCLMFGDEGELYVFSCCEHISVIMQST